MLIGAIILLSFLIVFLTLAGAFYPIIRILDRMGFPKRNVLLFYVPLVNLIFIWRVAFKPWPVEPGPAYSKVFL